MALFGTGELAEIALLSAQEKGIKGGEKVNVSSARGKLWAIAVFNIFGSFPVGFIGLVKELNYRM